MLKQVMFTCTSKAIKYKPPGLRWVCRPSHLGLTSRKHLAASCYNSIQVHFGLTQAAPLLVEVIPDYRATVVKCWYNVFFLFFSPLSLFLQLYFSSRSSHCSALVWLTLHKTDVSFQFNTDEKHSCVWLWGGNFFDKPYGVEFIHECDVAHLNLQRLTLYLVFLNSVVGVNLSLCVCNLVVRDKSRQATDNWNTL